MKTKILIASDSFKDCLTAKQVALHLAAGIKETMRDTLPEMVPVADGGEGTVQALIDATGGEKIQVQVHDPLMRSVESFYGILGDGNTAIIEMAAAAGLDLLTKYERNPLITTTYGVGELILDALNRGCKKLIIGLGGSATNDGGAGMLEALGVKFLDKDGEQLEKGGGALSLLTRVDITGLDPRLAACEVIVATDVQNPLLGPEGTTHTYARQKGADRDMIRALEVNMRHFAFFMERYSDVPLSDIPGGGAAGGMGTSMMALMNAELVSGFDVVNTITGLEEKIKAADLVVTGEGRMDKQSGFGKAPIGVVRLAVKHNKPVVVVAGALAEGYEKLYEFGMDVIIPISLRPLSLQLAIRHAPELLEHTGNRIARWLMLGNRMGN